MQEVDNLIAEGSEDIIKRRITILKIYQEAFPASFQKLVGAEDEINQYRPMKPTSAQSHYATVQDSVHFKQILRLIRRQICQGLHRFLSNYENTTWAKCSSGMARKGI